MASTRRWLLPMGRDDSSPRARESVEFGPARIEVRLEDWPGGEPGVWMQIGESGFHFPIEGAERLKEALEDQIGHARAIKQSV